MTVDRRRVLGLLASGAVPVLGGCLDAAGSDGETTVEEAHRIVITIRDGEFDPGSKEVAAGHDVTVVFENQDDHERVLRSDVAGFDLTVPPGETVHRDVTVPETPGDYEIDCVDGARFELQSVPADVLGGCGYDSDE